MGILDRPGPQGTASASITAVLTTLQNAVQAINGIAQGYLNVQGAQSLENISTTTAVKTEAGRVCKISVTTAGSTTGIVYDSNSTNSLVNPAYVIPKDVGLYDVNWPVGIGIVIAPGTNQVLAISYS